MTDVSLDSFLVWVLPYTRDCPDLVARQAVLDALTEFCNESHWWVEQHVTLSVIAALNNYELDPPTDTDVVAVNEVRLNGQLLEPKSLDDLNTLYRGQDWRTVTGTPRFYVREDPGEVLLVPTPDTTLAQALTMSVVLRPSRAAAYVSDEFHRRWGEEIAMGARARLHMHPGQPYYSETQAAYCRAGFVRGIAKARIERNTGQNRATPVMRYPRFV